MMKTIGWMAMTLLFSVRVLAIGDDYQLGPDSLKRHEGVPRGRVEKFQFPSEIYPGTTRTVWVYIPAQYDPAKPADLMVYQDGAMYVGEAGEWRATIVMDNLIAAKQIPVMIGVFINPGNDPIKNPPATKPATGKAAPDIKKRPVYSNRSVEYDSLGDTYSKFLLNEVLPEVVKRYDLKITSDPQGRGIAGASSGGICAFTVAWERPDQFSKVASCVGSFTNIRGGNKYPQIVLSGEKKPIRVSLQDGKNDLQNQFGNWFEANTAMAAALKEKGYDYQFIIGEGGHNSKHGGSIFPDTMRWLWRED